YVDINQIWTDQRVPAEIAALIQRPQLECRHIPITIRSAKYGVVRSAGFEIWSFIQRKIRRIQITRPVVTRDLRRERCPAINECNVVHLPSFEESARDTARILRKRQIVSPIERQVVLHVKCRKPAIICPIVDQPTSPFQSSSH